MILFNDFSRETAILGDELIRTVRRVFDSGWYVMGKELEAFEHDFAAYIGCRYCIGVASGTEAIALALMAHQVGEGDEVITTNLTAFPTITGIMQAGARPVTVDIFNATGLIDHSLIEAGISARTKAIVPVHLYGQSCDMDEIRKIASKNKLLVIEDCAQSTGAVYKGRKCGTLGDCAAFSFYPTKNLGAYGDGGAVLTDREDIRDRLLALRNYGQTKRYYHEVNGINSRLDEIQAAVLNLKLRYLDRWNLERQSIARVYRENLTTVDCLREESYGKPVYHLFVVKSVQRDKLIKHLADKQIQVFIHYPVPVNRQTAFEWQKDEKMEQAALFADSVLSLPVYPGLTSQHIDQIINTVNEFKA